MLRALLLFVLSIAAVPQPLSKEETVRVAEFYRLAGQIQDRVWPNWSKVPAPLLLVTENTEFLTHDPHPPKEFGRVGKGVFARPRRFDTNLLATFPAFGLSATIVIGVPANTAARTSTPWVITVMHEHFHQLQYAQPGYYGAVASLGLSGGDKTGMWILDYAFPYDDPKIEKEFATLKDLLLSALAADEKEFRRAARCYLGERRRFFGLLTVNDRKYLSFQLWQEGIARYTQVISAEAAAQYKPSTAYVALSDYESFSSYASRARRETMDELRGADLTAMKRSFVYPFGAAEGFLLDRISPQWKLHYFEHLLSTEPLFENVDPLAPLAHMNRCGTSQLADFNYHL